MVRSALLPAIRRVLEDEAARAMDGAEDDIARRIVDAVYGLVPDVRHPLGVAVEEGG